MLRLPVERGKPNAFGVSRLPSLSRPAAGLAFDASFHLLALRR